MKRKYRIVNKIHKNSYGEFVGEVFQVQHCILFLWCDELNYNRSLFNTRKQAEKYISDRGGTCADVKKVIDI